MSDARQPLGVTALAVWRTWRALPWQGLPCYGLACAVGEFCWLPDAGKPDGMALHRVLNVWCTRPATQDEEDDVWTALVTGKLQRYARSGFKRAPTDQIELALQRLTA